MHSLYVKTHRLTGLKYLGYTSQDPYNYRGSGLRWSAHLRKHGNDVITEVIAQCETKAEIKELGIYYSNLWNVTESRNWANLQPEEGQGFASGKHHPSKRPGCINGATLLQTRKKFKERMLSLGDKHPSKTKEFRKRMSGNNNPAHLPHVKDRMTNNNPMKNPLIVAKLSGANNAGYDHTIYNWKNINTGEQVSMTRHDLYVAYSLSAEHVGRVARKVKGFKSVKGWTLDE